MTFLRTLTRIVVTDRVEYGQAIYVKLNYGLLCRLQYRETKRQWVIGLPYDDLHPRHPGERVYEPTFFIGPWEGDPREYRVTAVRTAAFREFRASYTSETFSYAVEERSPFRRRRRSGRRKMQ